MTTTHSEYERKAHYPDDHTIPHHTIAHSYTMRTPHHTIAHHNLVTCVIQMTTTQNTNAKHVIQMTTPHHSTLIQKNEHRSHRRTDAQLHAETHTHTHLRTHKAVVAHVGGGRGGEREVAAGLHQKDEPPA